MRKLTMDELNRLSKEEYEKVDKLPVVIVLDNIRSLSNVGAVFRSADAFRISEIFLCGITACPPHREIHKTALGADETVAWRYFDSTEAACLELKSRGYRIVAVEQVEGSTMLHEYQPEPNTAYVLGNEVDGVSSEILPLCDSALEIPQEGTKHSLNVSVCAGIIMWYSFQHLFLSRRL
ncbi:MAG: RNA methyltransferase [Bacteroidales bacterium]|nr:RNA methyltransferase [Bacteroidales bacterium]